MRTILYLVRGTAPPAVVTERDWVLYLEPAKLAQGGTPHTAPLPPGPVDHDQIVELVFAADLVVTW